MSSVGTHAESVTRPAGTIGEVLLAFAKLGVTSFGGPIAHIGYFRAEFVERRRWLDERAFAELVGLCQFLPGPASSQAGFALGLMRAGYGGGIAAWLGFTLPSALLMLLFAYGAAPLAQSATGGRLLHGLMLVASAIVAQAVWGMARTLCPDRARASIAVVAAAIVLFAPPAVGQLASIGFGAFAGLVLCHDTTTQAAPAPILVSRPVGALCLVAVVMLLFGLPFLSSAGRGWALFDAFVRSGALVFGGGHVVLPLLHDALVTPGFVSESNFLAGYGAAQAMPGPLFTFAAYLGAVAAGVAPDIGSAAIALVAIFLPGLLLLVGVLPYWQALRGIHRTQAAMSGINAAIVGLLGAALYTPIWTSTILGPTDFALALAGFVLLTVWRAPPLVVVLLGAGAGLVVG